MNVPIPVLEVDENEYQDAKRAYEAQQEQKRLAEQYPELEAKRKAHQAHQDAVTNAQNSRNTALNAVNSVKQKMETRDDSILNLVKHVETTLQLCRDYDRAYNAAHPLVTNAIQWQHRANSNLDTSWLVPGDVEDFFKANGITSIHEKLNGNVALLVADLLSKFVRL